jgi:RNA polymerase sigma-70 factor, ECF subfamily
MGNAPSLQTLAERSVDEGRARWPSVRVDERAYVRFLRDTTGGSPTDGVRAERWLTFACGQGDEAAIAAFEREYLADALQAVRSLGSEALVGDVEGRVRRALFVAEKGRPPKILEYSGRGSLKKWVRTVALRVALPLQERSRREQALQDLPAGDPRLVTSDPELQFLKGRYRADFRAAFARAISLLPMDDAHVLRLSALENLSIDEIARLYGVHRATAARRVTRAKDAVYALTRTELMSRLRISPKEFESVMGLVRSNLDVSLAGALKARRLA